MNQTRSHPADNRGSIAALFELTVYALTLLFIFTIPWENALRIPGIGTVSRAIGVPLIAAWVIMQFSSLRLREFNSVHLWTFAFVFWVGLAQLWSVDTNLALVQTKTFLQLLFSMFILWSVLDSRERVRWALQAFVAGAIIVALIVFYNYAQGNVTRWTRRASIAGVDENDIALVLAIALPAALYLATTAGTRIKRRVSMLLNFTYVPAGIIAITMTGSRGGVASMLPFLVYGLYLAWRSRARGALWLIVLVPIIVFVVWTFAPDAPLQRIATTFEEIDSGNVSGRGTIWAEGLEQWLSGGFYSIFGLGSGGYVWSVGRAAHSTPLSILVEGGVIGFVLFLGIIISLALICRRAQPAARAVCLAMLASWFIGTLALSWEYRKPTWVVWSLVLCVAVSHRSAPRRHRAQQYETVARRR